MARIATGAQLATFINQLNAEADIDLVLMGTLVDAACTILEEEREWQILRKTNTSINVTTGNTWQTALSLGAAVTDFGRFYGEFAIRLFDGGDRVEYYRNVPFDRRLEYKNDSNTCCFDDNAGILYLNGTVAFAGTLYVNYIATSVEIDLEDETDDAWQPFPTRFLPVLGFYAIGVFKGAVDYDSINREMLPMNAATLLALKNAFVKWDDARQRASLEQNDPTELYSYPRSRAIDRNE